MSIPGANPSGGGGMDRIALETLRQELLSDGKIVLDAFSKAGKRMALESEVGYEGCAHHLCRLYKDRGIHRAGETATGAR